MAMACAAPGVEVWMVRPYRPYFHLGVGLYHTDAQVEHGIKHGVEYFLTLAELNEILYMEPIGFYYAFPIIIGDVAPVA